MTILLPVVTIAVVGVTIALVGLIGGRLLSKESESTKRVAKGKNPPTPAGNPQPVYPAHSARAR